jgi:hypothetical protein
VERSAKEEEVEGEKVEGEGPCAWREAARRAEWEQPGGGEKSQVGPMKSDGPEWVRWSCSGERPRTAERIQRVDWSAELTVDERSAPWR